LDGVIEFDELDRSEKKVEMNTSEINKRLGTEITTDEIVQILTKLRFDFEQDNNHFTVSAPTRRGDIAIFEDMLEEVARIYGYDHLPYTLPSGASQAGGLTERQQLKREVKNYMQSVGLMETITYSLTSKDNVDRLIDPEIKARNFYPVEL